MNPIIFSPIEIASLSSASLSNRRDAYERGGIERGLPMYSRKLDTPGNDGGFFLPLLPAEMATIIARPGHGKSSFMMRWARERVNDIQAHAKAGDPSAARRVVVYATYEQTVEDLNAFHVAASSGISVTDMAIGKIDADQWQQVEDINARRMASPLWFLGHSLERRAARPRITVEMLQQALLDIENWQNSPLIIDAVFVDYLQRIPYEGRDKNVGISDNLDELKNMAQAIGAPVVVGVQATREVDKRDDPAPEVYDGQWTSNIEQSSDRVITLLRPSLVKEQGDTYREQLIKGYNLMLVSIQKQKLGAANFARFVEFDPRYNRLNDIEIIKARFNED